MNAMIFAAGLGTRLKPYTDYCPKAMVEVAGKPMIAHQLQRLKEAGFSRVVINVHHFAEQIISYIAENNSFGLDVAFSDERGQLLDTGGGIRKAIPLFDTENPVLIHNVDVFSNIDLSALYVNHQNSNADASLLVSSRNTSRYLIFNIDDSLVAWKNIKTGEVRTVHEDMNFLPECTSSVDNGLYRMRAFAGIHVISPTLFPILKQHGEVFSIINFYLQHSFGHHIRCIEAPQNFSWVDAGKPETLAIAADIVASIYR